MDFEIYMPTRGRTELKLQSTLNLLCQDIKKLITVVCHPGEESWFYENYGEQVKSVISLEVSHIGELRQKCIDMSPSDNIIFVDDSLNFHARGKTETENDTKYPLKGLTERYFSPTTIEDLQLEMFSWLMINISSGEYGMVGISRRHANGHNLQSDTKENERVCSFWGINRKLFNSLKGHPKFSDMQLKEDFYITLNFLTNGIKLITSYKFAYDRVGGANTKGGCSIYRNIESQNASAITLKEHFPEFVKIREKSVKSWNGDFEETALDVTVYAKKAYESGINK